MAKMSTIKFHWKYQEWFWHTEITSLTTVTSNWIQVKIPLSGHNSALRSRLRSRITIFFLLANDWLEPLGKWVWLGMVVVAKKEIEASIWVRVQKERKRECEKERRKGEWKETRNGCLLLTPLAFIPSHLMAPRVECIYSDSKNLMLFFEFFSSFSSFLSLFSRIFLIFSQHFSAFLLLSFIVKFSCFFRWNFHKN